MTFNKAQNIENIGMMAGYIGVSPSWENIFYRLITV